MTSLVLFLLVPIATSYLHNPSIKFACLAKYQFSNKSISGVNFFGGVNIKQKNSGKKNKSPLNEFKEMFNSVEPATRIHLIMSLVCTTVDMCGLPAPEMFSIDIHRPFQLWRFFTSMAYLGRPSMSMANNVYFLVKYGQELERHNGTPSHLWFLIIQTILLSFLGVLLKFPFQARSIIAAAVYTSSQIHPFEKIPINFGLVVSSWQLPFCMMMIECLSQQSFQASWPYVMGILTGHMFHFFRSVWPSLGGKEYLKTPFWITFLCDNTPWLQGNSKYRKSNVIDYRIDRDASRSDSKKGIGKKSISLSKKIILPSWKKKKIEKEKKK